MIPLDRAFPSSPKKDLRRLLIQQRQALSISDWQAKSEAICQHLAQAEVYQKARTVAAFFSTRQEPDFSSLWSLRAMSKRWGLPRCAGKDLTWHECSPTNSEHFQNGLYGIQEPRSSLPTLEAEDIDLILVPAVACDSQGFRIGYGGGFYDRLFSRTKWADTPTIGIVFDFAYLVQVPTDPWDCPVQAVCTERGLFSVRDYVE